MPDNEIETSEEVDPSEEGLNVNASNTRFPPTDANIPSPPKGFKPTKGSDYFGVVPKTIERFVIATAVEELRRSPDLADILGSGVPDIEDIAIVFDAAAKWSIMRAQASKWDLYCRTQEGLAWIRARKMMARVKTVFNLAAKHNAELGIRFPALKTLLNAASEVAHRAAATKKEKRRKKLEEEAAAKAAKESGGEGGTAEA